MSKEKQQWVSGRARQDGYWRQIQDDDCVVHLKAVQRKLKANEPLGPTELIFVEQIVGLVYNEVILRQHAERLGMVNE